MVLHSTNMNTTVAQPQAQQQQLEGGKEEGGHVPLPYCGFSSARRRFIIAIVSAAGFLGPLAGGIYLPALPVLAEDFNVGSAAINGTVSVFMALCAFAPLFWSAFADWKGRRPLYITSLAIYLLANILMAALPANFGALVFLRMVQAFGCSSVISLGAGTIADVRMQLFVSFLGFTPFFRLFSRRLPLLFVPLNFALSPILILPYFQISVSESTDH